MEIPYLQEIGVNLDFQFVLLFAGLIWIRVLSAFSVIPFLFSSPVPMYLRVSASAVITLYLVGVLLPAEMPMLDQNMAVWFILMMKEVLYGFMIGFTASLMFYCFEGAGHMIENQRGMAIARILIPQLGTQGTLGAALFLQLTIVVYLVLGGHLVFLQQLFESFHTLPVLAFPSIDPGWRHYLEFMAFLSGDIIRVALAIAAPVIIAVLMADIILGVANRVAPQINVWELGFSIKGYLGILLMFFMMTMILRVMEVEFAESHLDQAKAIHYLGGGVPETEADAIAPYMPKTEPESP